MSRTDKVKRWLTRSRTTSNTPTRNVDISSPRFRERLVDLRRRTGMSRDEVACELGVSTRAYTNWETGNQKKAMDHNVMKLAQFYGVEYEYLVATRSKVPVARISAGLLTVFAVLFGVLAFIGPQNTIEFTRVMTMGSKQDDMVRFEDLDGDGMVEYITNSLASRFVLPAVLDTSDPDDWKHPALFQLTRTDDFHQTNFVFDVSGDGWGDLFLRAHDESGWYVEVIDGRSGDSIKRFSSVTGRPGPTGEWLGAQSVVAVVPSTALNDTLVVTMVQTGRGAYTRYIQATSFSRAEVTWQYRTGAYVGECYAQDLDGDGEWEFLVVCPSTDNGGFENGHGDDKAWLIALDTNGEELWTRQVGNLLDHVTATLLCVASGAPLAFTLAENRSATDHGPSWLRLVDMTTGSVVDSLAHSDQIANKAIAYAATSGASHWNVFYGTTAGVVRALTVADGAMKTKSEAKITDDVVWVCGVLAGPDKSPVVVANTAGGIVVLLDEDLVELARRERLTGGRYLVRDVFSDLDGAQYLAMFATPDQICVERVSFPAGNLVHRLVVSLVANR